MKVIGINGSARMDGNTALIIREVFSELEKNGIETELAAAFHLFSLLPAYKAAASAWERAAWHVAAGRPACSGMMISSECTRR